MLQPYTCARSHRITLYAQAVRVVAHAQLVYSVVSGSRVTLIRNPRVTAKAEVGSRVSEVSLSSELSSEGHSLWKKTGLSEDQSERPC